MIEKAIKTMQEHVAACEYRLSEHGQKEMIQKGFATEKEKEDGNQFVKEQLKNYQLAIKALKTIEPRFLLDKDSICYGCKYYISVDDVDVPVPEDDVSCGGVCDCNEPCFEGNLNEYRAEDSKTKYTWSFDRHTETSWNNATFETIKECIGEAIEMSKDYGVYSPTPDKVYIGECREFIPYVDGETVLEQLVQDAYDEYGEVGGDWEAYDYTNRTKAKKELDELDETLTNAVSSWLRKYNYYPTFCRAENIKEYSLKED